MAKHSKRFNAAFSQVNRMNYYAPEEAVSLVKQLANAKFDETIEVHLRMGVDPKYSDQQVRGVVTLPNGIGRTVRILVFANPEGQALATAAGADYVGAEDLGARIEKGWTDFDIVLATPDMMRVVGKLGRVLGPRGLMPSPKAGTVVNDQDVAQVVKEIKGGRMEFRLDKTANLHIPIGKKSFAEQNLVENMAAAMDAIVRAKPTGAKGNYIQSVTLATTMGPGIKLDLPAALAMSN